MRVGDFKPRKLHVDEQATSADWPFQINELSNDKLTQYKRAAALDAGQADKEGDFERGDKRFSGIIKATKKQFANDVKKHKDTKKESVEEMARPVTTTPDAATNVKKLWLYVQRNLTDLASMASFYDDRKELYIEDRLNNLLKTANGQPVKVAFDMGYGFELRDNILYIPIGVMWQYRGMYTSQTFIQKVMSALDSQAMSHTANSLANPPEVMQRRARRDQERQERYNNAQKSSSSEQGDEGEWVDAKGSLKEFAPTDNGNSGGGGDKKSYLLQLADNLFQAIYVAKNKLVVKAVKDKIVAVGGRVEIVWNDNGSFNVVMYHPTYFKQGHLISLVGDRGQDMAEGTDYPYNRHRRSTVNSRSSPELRHVPVPGDMSHPEWREPLWSFQEISDKLGIGTDALKGYMWLYPGFPEKKQGIKSSYGSKTYYSQRDVKRWVNANDIRNIIKSKQGVKEGMTPPGEFLNKQERLKAGDKVIYKGKVVGIATGKMDGDKVIFKPNQNYGNDALASLPIDQINLRENTAKDINEFAPIKPPTAGAFGGNKDYGQPNSSRYIGNGKFVVGTTNNYVLTATVDKWGLEWDEDDEIWFLDSPGAAHIADASEGEIELPPPREQRNQIHDLVTDYLNAHNSADLQKAAAYYGHSTDGEMANEGVRVSGQQIPGTKNRAKTAYYPTNVPPKVKKLDKPLTDKELARLSNQGNVKEFVQTAPIATPTGDTPPSHGFAIKVHGPFGQRQGGIAAVALWEALSAVFPDRYPSKDYQNYGAQLDSPQARVLNQIHRSGSAVVADGLASRDLAETLANKLAVFKPDSELYVNPIGIKHVEVIDQGVAEGKKVDEISNFMTQPTKPVSAEEQWKRQIRLLAKQYQTNAGSLAALGRENGPDSAEAVAYEYLRNPSKIRVPGATAPTSAVNWDEVIRRLPIGLSGMALLQAAEEYLINNRGMLRSTVRSLLNNNENQRSLLAAYDKKKVHETIAPITVDEILEGLDADQKRVGQVGGKEKAKKIGTVLGTAPKKHPFNKRLVGE
jgi:hypothetical protein